MTIRIEQLPVDAMPKRVGPNEEIEAVIKGILAAFDNGAGVIGVSDADLSGVMKPTAFRLLVQARSRKAGHPLMATRLAGKILFKRR